MPTSAPAFPLPLLPWLLASLPAQDPASPPPVSPPHAHAHAHPEAPLGTQDGTLRLLDVSLTIMGALGASTASDDELRELKGGAHDPRKRGFTLQEAELSLAGAVDQWFEARAFLIAALDPYDGETVVELEEAYLTTRQLPADLQLKAGTWFTHFGRINPLHPHAWDWQDQPVMMTRLFGGDGMRGPGAQLSWSAAAAPATELVVGVQNANGETMVSFLANEEVYEERPIGGRLFADPEVHSSSDLVYSLRAATTFALGAASELGLGASALFGPNATGGDGDTVVWGVDFLYRWQPEAGPSGRPFVEVQGEYLARAFDAVAQTDASDPGNPVALPEERLEDRGGYLQGLYGFAAHWAAGVRVELATGSGDSYLGGGAFGRAEDPWRADRIRVSPLLSWQLSEFSRLRLQYDYDDSDHLDDEAHSLWLGFDVRIGTHRPHGH